MGGKLVSKQQMFTFEFNYSFLIGKRYLTIYQVTPDFYELRIDNVSFNSIQNKEKIERQQSQAMKKKEEGIGYSMSRGPSQVTSSNVAKSSGSNTTSNVKRLDEDFYNKPKP